MANDSHIHLTAPDVNARSTAQAFLSEMMNQGIERAAVVTPSTMGWDNSVTLQAVQDYPDRFIGIGRIDFSEGRGVTPLRALLDSGIRGIRLTFMGAEVAPLSGDAARIVGATLADADAVAEFHVSPDQLSVVAKFASDHPAVSVIVDHLGRPVSGKSGSEEHLSFLRLADLPNVFAKTPGFGFFSKRPFPHEDIYPFIDSAIDAFGAHRIMWGSDWPGCEDFGPYGDALSSVKRSLDRRSSQERAFVLRDTFQSLFP